MAKGIFLLFNHGLRNVGKFFFGKRRKMVKNEIAPSYKTFSSQRIIKVDNDFN
jgi:hypothetical protein